MIANHSFILTLKNTHQRFNKLCLRIYFFPKLPLGPSTLKGRKLSESRNKTQPILYTATDLSFLFLKHSLGITVPAWKDRFDVITVKRKMCAQGCDTGIFPWPVGIQDDYTPTGKSDFHHFFIHQQKKVSHCRKRSRAH